MKYDVFVFPIVRVKFTGIEANSQEDAIKKAEEEADFHALLDRDNVEYAEDIDCYEVDEEGNTDYSNSSWYDKNYCPL